MRDGPRIQKWSLLTGSIPALTTKKYFQVSNLFCIFVLLKPTKIKVMATRASVIFKEKGEPVFAMYKHYDGYPEGLGEELKSIVAAGKIVNGLGPDRTLGSYFNGYGCMWATIIAKLKDEPGNVYICKISDVGQQGEDYIYEMDEQGQISYTQNF